MKIAARSAFKSSLRLLLAVSILASSSSLAGPQKKTLKRTEDFVVFTGASVLSLIGAETGDLHLYACGPSGLHAVPFQVDKRDADGRFVFPNETAYDPLRDGVRLDSNDELVFMARDAGDRCASGAWAEGAEAGVELELVDPLDGGRAWAYLFRRPGADPPKTEDYVDYKVKDGSEYVLTDTYELGKALEIVGYDTLILRRPDGSWGRDVLELQKSWMRASLLKGALPVYFPPHELRCRTRAVIDGPVRVIRDEMKFAKVRVIGLEIINESFNTYYENGHVTPLEVTFPLAVNSMFLEIYFFWAMEYTDAVVGSTYRSGANPRGIVLDGRPDPQLDQESDSAYMTVSGPEGALIAIMEMGDLEPYELIRATHLEESPSDKGRDARPGPVIEAGYMLKNTIRIPRGTYHYTWYHYYPHPYSDGRVDEIKNLFKNPIKVEFEPLP